jgi:hypothetical protein
LPLAPQPAFDPLIFPWVKLSTATHEPESHETPRVPVFRFSDGRLPPPETEASKHTGPEGVGVLVGVSVTADVRVGVRVIVGVSVIVGVRVTVRVIVGVLLIVGVRVGVSVNPIVGVRVGVSEGPTVGVRVGVRVIVGVKEIITVGVTVTTGVEVRVGVAVASTQVKGTPL